MESRTRVVNLCGGPGVGKSTIASRIFSNLKASKVSCELVTEVPKEVTWEGNHKLLENQLYIFAEQFRRQWRLINKVDWVITDSPLIMYAVYLDYHVPRMEVKLPDSYVTTSRKFFNETFKQFNNVNFWVPRDKSRFDPNGRNQDLQESIELDNLISLNMRKNEVNWHVPRSSDLFGIADEITAYIKLSDLP